MRNSLTARFKQFADNKRDRNNLAGNAHIRRKPFFNKVFEPHDGLEKRIVEACLQKWQNRGILFTRIDFIYSILSNCNEETQEEFLSELEELENE